MLHRLRRAMVRLERELLDGEVEVDETYLAFTDRITPISVVNRKSNTTKVLMAIAVEMLPPKGFGRIRVQQIDRGEHENMMLFIKTSVRPGSLIPSDGSPAYTAYRQLQENGYGHRQSVHLGSITRAIILSFASASSCYKTAHLLESPSSTTRATRSARCFTKP
jgi:ISXO2-like transposase domain